MQAHFSIDVDPLTSTVSITMSGFFEDTDIERFVACRNTEHLRLRCSPNEHVTLIDIRGMNIQSQASVEQFANVISDPTYASRKIAFVVERSLARMQIQRAAAGRDAGFFLSQEEAETWLRLPAGRPALFGVSGHDTRSSAT